MNRSQEDSVELISIIEGPTPEFQEPKETWAFSLYEDSSDSNVAYCQMRTLNGPHMLERCQNAWAENRGVKLDFPDRMGLRQQAPIVAVRWSEVPEGHLLHLWLRRPLQEKTTQAEEDDDSGLYLM